MTLATAAEPFRDRRALVVGGLGFIGAAIAKALV
jgi:nucleoside-diphosphate-sugar epimerase